MRKDPPVSIPVDLRAVEVAAADFDADTGPEDVLALAEALRIAREALWGIAVKPDEAAGIADAVLASLDALVDFTADPQEADRPSAATPEGLSEENRALRELVEWAIRMVDGHSADLLGLRESLSAQATAIAIDRLTGGPK